MSKFLNLLRNKYYNFRYLYIRKFKIYLKKLNLTYQYFDKNIYFSKKKDFRFLVNEKNHDEIFILGSSKSLFNLKEHHKSYIEKKFL